MNLDPREPANGALALASSYEENYTFCLRMIFLFSNLQTPKLSNLQTFYKKSLVTKQRSLNLDLAFVTCLIRKALSITLVCLIKITIA